MHHCKTRDITSSPTCAVRFEMQTLIVKVAKMRRRDIAERLS